MLVAVVFKVISLVVNFANEDMFQINFATLHQFVVAKGWH